MKGLETIPGARELEGAYDALLRWRRGALRGRQPEERELALWTQWARFDPRLAELLVEALAEGWARLNPIALREALLAQPWPGVAGVLLEFAAELQRGSEPGHGFGRWAGLVAFDFPKGHDEQFFIGSRAPGGAAMLDDARFSLTAYRKWGYLSREIPVNKAASRGVRPRYDLETRMRILDALVERSARVTARDYWEAIGRAVSIRQAERDLLGSGRVHPVGRTKARWFRAG